MAPVGVSSLAKAEFWPLKIEWMSHPLREQAHSYSHSSVSACGVAMFDERAIAREEAGSFGACSSVVTTSSRARARLQFGPDASPEFDLVAG